MTPLSEKIENHTATVGVIGLGYVGIPLCTYISQAGFTLYGFDHDQTRVDCLNAGLSPIAHIPSQSIQDICHNGFQATTQFDAISHCDIILICVPTPLNKRREPDLSYVNQTMANIAPFLRKHQVISLESTTWPGTTEEILKPQLEQQGFDIGVDFHLVYSPEREDPGNEKFLTHTIPKIIGGSSDECRAIGCSFYNKFIDKIVPVSSTQAAEMVKLLENIHRSVNIGLANEMKQIAHALDLDIFEIIKAAATKPFGFTAFYPGPGVGGHCIPIDPFYLSWKAKEFGLDTQFISLAGEINAAMPHYVVEQLIKALNEQQKTLNGANILVLGIAYKKNVDDVRESPSVFIMEILRKWGAQISYSDPHVPNFPNMREHCFNLNSVELTPQTIATFDAVLLLTDHDVFDYDLIEANACLLLDTRGKFSQNMTIIQA